MAKRNYLKGCSRKFPNLDLKDMKTLPTNNEILERKKCLQNMHHGMKKSKYLSILCKEIEECWQKQDIPVQDHRSIYTKITRQTIPNNDLLFDCIPKQPIWKSPEDKAYYLNQKGGLGGHCTTSKVPYVIHPSKRIKVTLDDVQTKSEDIPHPEIDNISSVNEESDASDIYENQKEFGDVAFAEKLRETANLSISATIAVMKFYKISFPNLKDLPIPPSKSAISIKSRKEAKQYSTTVPYSESNQTLYFDMKSYNELYNKKREILCACVNNKLIQFIEIPNKRAETIANVLLKLIQDLRITRIVSDTEPAITGVHNGAIARIRKQYPEMIYEPCRLHILDLIIKNQIHFLLGNFRSTSPEIQYDCVQNIKNNWSNLRNEYIKIERLQSLSYSDLPSAENRRYDYRFLLELCIALRTFRERGDKPNVKIPLQPVNTCLARWNSKAIYCLMSELLAGNDSMHIRKLNDFIAYEWAPVWFGVRDLCDWSKFETLCEKSITIVKKYGLINKVENKPYTNERAERIFRLANEKIPRCKTVEDLRNSLIRYVNNTTKLNKTL